MDIGKILEALQCTRKTGSNTYQALCPAHDDKKQSLTITDAGDKILMHCHAGCDVKDILKKIGLKESDLFSNKSQQSRITAEYIYTDESHKPLYKVMRFEPKSFVQAKYDNGNWVFKMTGVNYVIYNLPNVLKSDIVYFVEGEKDADNLNSIGLTATTTVSGASGFEKRAEIYANSLKGKTVYIIPDNDEAGKKYAFSIMNSLKNTAKYVKILNLSDAIPGLLPKSDISDVISMYGKEETLKIIEKLKKTFDFSIYSGQHISIDIMKEIINTLNISVKYNEITKETEVKGLPSEYPEDSATEILPAFISEICIKYHIKYKDRDIKNELLLLSQANKYNPIQDMLTKNKWDNKDRFPILFEILGITEDSLSQILVKKWMYQTTMIVFNNKNALFGIEGVLVFQGNQDIGKTRFIRNMALNPDWFKEGASIDLNNKDSIIEASKGWIVELRRA